MKRNLMLAGLVMVLLVLVGSTTSAVAKVKIVATLSDLGSVAQIVGGDDVEVTVLCPGEMDPHFLPAKPSLARKLSKADMLIYNGLELEVGWLPQLINKARNPDIKPGSIGEVDCSAAVKELLEVPGANVDRSEGDVHPQGNPHYTLDPRRVVKVAELLAERLGRIDGDHAEAYLARAAAFASEVAVREAAWRAQTEKARAIPMVIYHRTWSYLVDWLGLDVVGEIEHRPGISPSPRHVQELVERSRKRDQTLVVAASWDHRHIAVEVAERMGAELVVIPAQTGASDSATDYFALLDTICRELAAAADRAGE